MVSSSNRTISVLAIDDDQDILDLTSSWLSRNPCFEVSTATSGDEGWNLIQTGAFDVVVSDYQMPGMDGLELLKTIRASSNSVPFILFTGKGRESIVMEALNHGADFYLQKVGEPVSLFAELAHKITTSVGRRRDEKEAEESLRRSRKELADIMEFLPDATVVVDLQGKVRAWNRAMEAMTGVSKEAMLGKDGQHYALPFYGEARRSLIDLLDLPDQELEQMYSYVERKGNTLFAETFAHTLFGGRGAYLWATAAPLHDNEGTRIGSIESIRDITDRICSNWKARPDSEVLCDNDPLTKVMTDLRRNQKELQEANRQLSLLNNITRHDVANQIMVLRAYAMLLRSTFLTPYQSGMIDKIDHSAENIQAQMDFAKIYQNIGTKEATWIDLHWSIVKAKSSLNLGSIQVEERGTDYMVLADRMFEKVVYNLIENAIRHGEGTKQIVISVLERGEEMDLVFEDDGHGIPARDRPHLFERGFGKNTGLGLFISREILAITGLSIVEASTDGMGARFIIKAPAGAWRKR